MSSSSSSSSTPFLPLPLDLAPQIASLHIPPAQGPTPSSQAVELSQARHRIRLLNSWCSIPPGARVLELGCGQGTCTAVLAYAVGDAGHVDAVDPARLEYGAPFTLAQAQGWISKGEVGGRISWIRDGPIRFLGKHEGTEWDVAVMAHCIWYFRGGAGELSRVLGALRGRVGRVCVAEYALSATGVKEAVPHVLAAIARGMLEAHRGGSSGENIQALISPDMVREVARGEGWKVEREEVLVPEGELSDGMWEVGSVIGNGFLEEVEKIEDGRVRAVLRSARDAVVAAVEGIGGLERVRTMDVWVATLVTQ